MYGAGYEWKMQKPESLEKGKVRSFLGWREEGLDYSTAGSPPERDGALGASLWFDLGIGERGAGRGLGGWCPVPCAFMGLLSGLG